jgi:hypothetical protein
MTGDRAAHLRCKALHITGVFPDEGGLEKIADDVNCSYGVFTAPERRA